MVNSFGYKSGIIFAQSLESPYLINLINECAKSWSLTDYMGMNFTILTFQKCRKGRGLRSKAYFYEKI